MAVLIVRATTRLCALPLVHVIEIMRPLPMEPARQAPAYVRGLSIIRGQPVPVVDLGLLLGDGDGARTARFVALRVDDRYVALAVDAVIKVRELDAAALRDMPPLLKDGLGAVETLGTLDAQLLLVLRAARLLPELS
jgi:purine-binding chemotaxis protein CheW